MSGKVLHYESFNLFSDPNVFIHTREFENYTMRLHSHDFFEVNIVLEGRGIHQIESKRVRVEAGDVFVIPRMIAHAYESTDNLRVYHLVLRNEFVSANQSEAEKIPGYISLTEIEPFLRQSSSESMILHLSPAELSEIYRELREVEADGKYASPEFFPLRAHAVWKILYKLSYLLHRQNETQEKSEATKYKREILDTLEYIRHNLSEKLTIESLACRVHLSRSTFLRSFQALCSCSPIQYLNNYRVQSAKALMKNEGMSKTEIAHLCGFYDLSHMEKAIRQHE